MEILGERLLILVLIARRLADFADGERQFGLPIFVIRLAVSEFLSNRLSVIELQRRILVILLGLEGIANPKIAVEKKLLKFVIAQIGSVKLLGQALCFFR